MNDAQNIKKLLLPGIKGSPIIVLVFLGAIYMAKQKLKKAIPQYQSALKLKLDDNSMGFSNSNLFKDFDVFTTSNKIDAEVEYLQSRSLIQRALERLDFDVEYSYERYGKHFEIYNQSPFKVKFSYIDERFGSRRIQLFNVGKQGYQFTYTFEGTKHEGTARWNDSIQTPHFCFHAFENPHFEHEQMERHNQYFVKYTNNVDLAGHYKELLETKSVEKEVPVIRLGLSHPVPEKVSLFLNTLADTYMNNYVDNRIGAAEKAVSFIDGRLEVLSAKLKASEEALEMYKLNNRIVNSRQETEIGLQQISQLQVQLANMVMQESSLDSLNEYINSKRNFLELAPQFEAFGDVLFVELIKEVRRFQQEIKDLSIKYTANSEKIQIIEDKIENSIAYIRESIYNAQKNIGTRKLELEAEIATLEARFQDLPTKEKELIVLEREFQLNQKVYNFFAEKRTEAAVAKAATISFHQIIEPALTPKKPYSPNRILTLFVSGVLGLIIGLILVYGAEYMAGRVKDKGELEKLSAVPVLGVFRRIAKRNKTYGKEQFGNLVNSILLKEGTPNGKMITVSSTIKGEGKSYMSKGLAQAFARQGYKTLWVDFDLRSDNKIVDHKGIEDVVLKGSSVDELIDKDEALQDLSWLHCTNEDTSPVSVVGHKNLPKILAELKQNYDVILMDTPGTAMALDAIPLMKASDMNLYVLRVKKTRKNLCINPDIIKEEHGIENLSLLLNGVHKATNYNGNYIGVKYSFHGSTRIFKLISYYFNTYFK